MSENIKVFAIKDPQGNFWRTPKGKGSWSSVGAAKNSWHAHSTYLEDYEYNGKIYKRLRHKRWDDRAEGWSIVQLKEYRLVEEVPNE